MNHHWPLHHKGRSSQLAIRIQQQQHISSFVLAEPAGAEHEVEVLMMDYVSYRCLLDLLAAPPAAGQGEDNLEFSTLLEFPHGADWWLDFPLLSALLVVALLLHLEKKLITKILVLLAGLEEDHRSRGPLPRPSHELAWTPD
jgi:hypothetical protein